MRGSRRAPRALLTALAAVLAALLAAPTAFAASTVASNGTTGNADATTITITGDSAANNITVTRSSTTVTVVDTTGAAPAGTPGNCVQGGNANTVTCDTALATTPISLSVTTLGNTDTVNLGGLTDSSSTLVDGGAEGDTLIGTPGNDANIAGGAGDDALTGNAGADTLNGGVEDDTLSGNAGADTLNGDAGDDFLSGGTENDTLNGGDDSDTLNGEDGNDVLNGGNGNDGGSFFGGGLNGGNGDDQLNGEAGDDTLLGGPGADALNGGADATVTDTPTSPFDPGFASGDTAIYSDHATAVNVSLDGVNNDADGDTLAAIENLTGGSGNDVLVGNAGRNTLLGNDGADTLTGGPGDDALSGDFGGANGGDDVLNGEDGDDGLSGGSGSDTLNGGNGDDGLSGDFDTENNNGNDIYAGGAGTDSANVSRDFVPAAPGSVYTGTPVRVTLDDPAAANDGPEGQNDRIGNDIEDVTTGDGNDNVTGSAEFNVISTGFGGADTVDPAAGSDVVSTFDRNDTINARDGFADDLSCGTGTDTANVDQLDRVQSDCEVVNRQTVPVALDDLPPTASFASPAANTKISPNKGATVTVNATDDHGIKEVRLLNNGVTVATDTTAPYSFDYKPKGSEVGKATLIAVAVDTVNQSASDFRAFSINRFSAPKQKFSAKPSRDRKAPFKFRFAGKLKLPAGVTAAQACKSGTITAQTKSIRGKTYSSRRTKIRKNCSYGVNLTFKNKKRLGNGKLKVRLRFSGNAVMQPFKTAFKNIRVG